MGERLQSSQTCSSHALFCLIPVMSCLPCPCKAPSSNTCTSASLSPTTRPPPMSSPSKPSPAKRSPSSKPPPRTSAQEQNEPSSKSPPMTPTRWISPPRRMSKLPPRQRTGMLFLLRGRLHHIHPHRSLLRLHLRLEGLPLCPCKHVSPLTGSTLTPGTSS